jgi:hypothetical protein
MSKKHDRRTASTTAKAVVLRLVGDGSTESYPHAPDSSKCYLCGVTLPQDMQQDGLGGFHTVTLNASTRHDPDCAWRMAYEYVNAHQKIRKQLAALSPQ